MHISSTISVCLSPTCAQGFNTYAEICSWLELNAEQACALNFCERLKHIYPKLQATFSSHHTQGAGKNSLLRRHSHSPHANQPAARIVLRVEPEVGQALRGDTARCIELR